MKKNSVTDNAAINNIVLLIISSFTAIALTYDKSIDVVDLQDLLAAQKTCLGIGPAMVLVSVFYCYRKTGLITTGIDKTIMGMSLVFSQCFWMGIQFDNDRQVFHASICGIIQWLMVSAGITFLCYISLKKLYEILGTVVVKIETTPEKKERKRVFSQAFITCIIVYSGYFLLFYPGVVTLDTYRQINQALGFSPLSNHHPFMHTLLEGAFIKPIYEVTGNVEYGIAAVSLFQIIVMSIIISYAQTILYELEIRKKARNWVLAFLVINPIFGMYSITLWKDVWMGMLLYLFLLILIKLVYLEEYSVKTIIELFLSSMAVMFAKATGIAMIGLALLSLLVYYRKPLKKGLTVSGTLLVAVICFISIQSIAINYYGVKPTEPGESKSVPLQQIARTVKEHDDDLTSEEKETIAEVLPYDDITELYNPRLSDPIKNNFRGDIYNLNKIKYNKLWFHLGMKYPASYVKSFLYNTYGYWSTESDYWVATADSYKEFMRNKDNKWVVFDNPNKYRVTDDYIDMRNKRLNIIYSIRRTPGVSLFFNIGAYFWTYAILALYAIRKRDAKYITASSLPLAVFISCLISPLYCEMRYAYPAVIIIPVMIILCLLPKERLE